MYLLTFRSATQPRHRRRRRAVDDDELTTTQLTTLPILTSTNAVNSTTTKTPEVSSISLTPDNSTDNTTQKKESEDEDVARSEIVVLANVTTVSIYDLDPFLEYSIEVKHISICLSISISCQINWWK